MADARINALTETTSLDATDWLVVEVGDSEARKVSMENLATAVQSLAPSGDADDESLIIHMEVFA